MYLCEEYRNEKYRNMKNPFKFGSIVDEPYFTNRVEEIEKLKNVLNSENHLIIISPRRFGKTSLIHKVVKELNRPVISLDLQLITSVEDLASQLLKRIYRVYPFEKVKQLIRNFRVIPLLSLNPFNNEVEVSFQPTTTSLPLIEDVLNLIETLGEKDKKPIVILDEFQEVNSIGTGLDRQLRSIMQQHQHISYVFLGSMETMMQSIFEKKKSPFYHFGMLYPLGKIPYPQFKNYLAAGFIGITNKEETLSDAILKFTDCHPYYTQQLAFKVWELVEKEKDIENPVSQAIEELVGIHDMDYERLWNTFNQTDKKVLIGLSFNELSPLTEAFQRKYSIAAHSTTFSSIKRLMQMGYVLKNKKTYEIDDPFFVHWIKQKREQ